MAGEPRFLEDGRYDVLVVEATPSADGSCQVELTIVAGPHKGEVVALRAGGLAGRALDLLGTPGTLTVEAGEPHLDLEP